MLWAGPFCLIRPASANLYGSRRVASSVTAVAYRLFRTIWGYPEGTTHGSRADTAAERAAKHSPSRVAAIGNGSRPFRSPLEGR